MKLYFENSFQQRRLIGEPATSKESLEIISRFFKERNFEIYYVRQYTTPEGETIYDVGSHSEFFVEVEE